MEEVNNSVILERLKKIEGQARGIIRMVEEGRYCIDILTQTRAIASAVKKVEEMILQRHLATCVSQSMQSKDEKDKAQKIDEIMEVIGKMSGR